MRAFRVHQWRKLSSSPDRISTAGGITADHPVLLLLSRAAAHCSPDLRAVHAHFLVSGALRHPFAASRLVDLFLLHNKSKLNFHHIFLLFDSLPNPDVYTWNTLLSVLVSPRAAIQHYFRMRAARAPPNALTFGLLVKPCMNPDTDVNVCRQVHCQVYKCGAEDFTVVRNSILRMYCNLGLVDDAGILFGSILTFDVVSWNTMISAYSKNHAVEKAKELFDRIPSRSLVTWSSMIDGHIRSGEFSEALNLFGKMQVEKVKPDAVTVVSMLKACAALGAIDQGRWLHLYIDRNTNELIGKDGNVILSTALIDMYAKCGCIDAAMQVFDNVCKSGDVVLWNAIISGLALHGHGEDAIALFRKMEKKGMVPNATTFICVLTACVHSGLLDEGREIFRSMRRYGIEAQREHYGCLADLLGRAARVEEAEDVLRRMPMEPHASQWGALMSACRMHNYVDVGERVGMHLISLEPNDGGRYVQLANTYAAAGRWDHARCTRKVMEEKGAKKETAASFIEWRGTIHEFTVGDMTHPQSSEIYAMLDEIERKLEINGGYTRDATQSLIDVDIEEEKGMVLSYHSERLAIAFGILNVDDEAPIRIVKNLRVCRDCHNYTKLVSRIYCREIIVRDRNRFHRFIGGSCSCNDFW